MYETDDQNGFVTRENKRKVVLNIFLKRIL